MTLGRQSGNVTIGRPLDIRVQVLSASDEDLAGQCLRTEVYFGDALVSPGAVRTTVLRGGASGDATLRIQTTQAVNEPVVGVAVRAGCNVPFSRRFELLADFEMEQARSDASGPGVTASGVDGTAAVDALAQTLPRLAPARGSERLDASGLRSETVLPARRPARVTPADATGSERAASVVRRPGPDTVTGPRLQLDPVDNNLSFDRDPVLRLSMAMLGEPTATDEERAAAGLLWKALNASPEDILRDTQKLSVLEAESKGLREQEARNKVTMQEMEAKLEATRYVTWLAYLLGALLLLSLAAMLFLLRKRREPGKGAGNPWWDSGEKGSSKSPLNARSTVQSRREPGVAPLDLDLANESSFDDYKPLHEGEGPDSMGAPLTASARDGSGGGQGIGSRSLATEELFDVQQQADFFVSLGETEKAIEVLKEHLADSQEPSPLAYLDLFRLYNQRGQRAEYEALRVDFNRTFNAGAPPFDQYSDDNRGLEAYETAFGRIQALWPQPRVLDVIEQSIFKEPSDPEGEVFGLEAYRELLLLHAVAKEMVTRDQAEEESQPGDFEHTSIKPLRAAQGSAAAAAAALAVPQPISEIPHVSPRLGLDVDLDALSEMSAFEASLPEVTMPVQPSAARGPVEPLEPPDSMKGNLIDFEVLDFASSEQDALKARYPKDGGKSS